MSGSPGEMKREPRWIPPGGRLGPNGKTGVPGGA